MRAAKIDARHVEVRDAFRNCGALVFDTSAIGKGFPDLVVNWRGRVMLVEVKAPKGTLTKQQRALVQQGWPVAIIRSREEVYGLLGVKLQGVPRSTWESDTR